jgi:two-component system response regulator YesN
MHKIYLVDDDQLTLDKYWARRRLFMECSFEISGAETDPRKALEEIRAIRPDAVLSDLKMPGLTGIELLEELMRDTLRPLFVIVSAYTEYKEIRKLFLTHGFDYLVKPVADSELIELLNRLADKINYTQPAIERKTESRRLDEILQYLRDYSHMNHSLESIGEHFSIKSGALCNLFSKHMNTTFSAYLNSVRMERAKVLLLSTHKQLKEIAVICGYSDAFYFTRVFHKTYGMSPSRFRQEQEGPPPPQNGHE